MADGVCLLVDAFEPMPQTRFVLQKRLTWFEAMRCNK
jgi:predicted membrane GTPase involved in stress response